MKRLWITLLVIAMATILAIPAGAGAPGFCDKRPEHPNCVDDDPEPQDVVVCEFEADGKLKGYDGNESALYKCQWTITGPGPFTFTLKAVSGEAAALRPHLFVTDAYPIGDKCFDQMENGWQVLSQDPYEPVTFGPITLPADGACDSQTYNITDTVTDNPDDVYSLIIAARSKGAELGLWLEP
jgi:hypothetical protein